MSEDCPFCDPPHERIFHEEDLILGIWDGFPVSEGHALLVTRRHVASWFDATAAERHALASGTEAVRAAIEARFGSSDYNVGVNVGPAAGQTIPHLHLHVIPRRLGDVPDPRGGVRHVIPTRGNYLTGGAGDSGLAAEAAVLSSPASVLAPAVVGEPDDPLLPHLVGHLDRAERADLVVAFVMNSGIELLDDALRNFLLRGGELRLLTGDYLDVTEPRALHRLLDLVDFARATGGDEARARVTLRIFETRGTSFHPKAYLFRLRPDDGRPSSIIAYVGSSNLSATALDGGIEWNYRVLASRDRAGLAAVEHRLGALFLHPKTRPLTHSWVTEYSKRRRADPMPRAASGLPPEPPPSPPEPTAIQREALTALQATRADGNEAGLVVMATGLGKTFLAAFDAASIGARRVLFVAHREEILRQAQIAFRRVMPEATIGLHLGGARSPHADVVMASIQTLERPGQLNSFARDAFDYVVVDEFHHAAARTYRRMIGHFTPRFLLGLTATPERTDGGDLLGLCGENIVYRCDLRRGIEDAPDRLVPFHYFGIPDDVDYSNIPWRSNRFDVERLTLEVATDRRAASALAQWRKHAGSGSRTLAFCCSQVHADFMSRYFKTHGVRACALHSGETSAPRNETLRDLGAGAIDIVFAVDILNEGVDIPSVNAVMMLRPTESRIIFQQQLGRGLRRAPGKDHLTVIDYVGNHRSFLLRPTVLFSLDNGDANIETALSRFTDGRYVGPELPPGCEVTYDLRAIDLLRAQLRHTTAAEALVAWYDEFKLRHGERPLAVEAFHEGRNPRSTRASHGSWLRFVKARGDLSPTAERVLALDAAGAFLTMLEVTAMTRSFKMLLLQALIHQDALPGSVSLVDLTREFTRIASRHASLRADVGEDLASFDAMRANLLRNPIAAWCRPQPEGAHSQVFFEHVDESFRSTFDVPTDLRSAFVDLVGEVVEWRIASYLATHPTAFRADLRIKCKVLRNARHAILKLPDRSRYEDIPEGDVPMLVNDGHYVARFASQYVNVLTEKGKAANRLGEILADWFGGDAGAGGTHHFVAFERKGDTWTLRPLDPREATGLGVDRTRSNDIRAKVHSDDGSALDASFSIEQRDGTVSVIVEARGGTRGTPRAVNTDYAAGLELLLRRLQSLDASITRALLETRVTLAQPVEQRVLRVRGDRRYPIRLALETDLTELRRALMAAQGNNPTRRMRLDVTTPSVPGIAELARVLAGPGASPVA